MKKLFLLFVLFSLSLGAQTYKITYGSTFEGKSRPGQDPVVAVVDKDTNYILSEKMLKGDKKVPYEILKTDTRNFSVTNFGFLKNNEIAAAVNDTIIGSYHFELKPETKKILGYTCKRAVAIVKSNTMEVWYTTDLKLHGGSSLLGQSLGLVLEVVRNGSSSTKAQKIEKEKKFDIGKIFDASKAHYTDEVSYKDLLWKSRFTTLQVFKDEIINFTDQVKSGDSILRFANGTIILKKVKFPEIKPGELIFTELSEQSNGDAYDRTGTVFMIPEQRNLSFFDALTKGAKTVPAYDNGNGKLYYGVEATPSYLPAIELMRFFTPFGIHQFNSWKLKGKEWHDKVYYRQDISDFYPELSGKTVWIGAFIGNYDKGGHKVSLDITIHKGYSKTAKDNFVLPVFNTLNIMEMAGQDYSTMFDKEKGLEVSFELDKDVKNAELRYITTGHGGWGNGDEFVPKENTILLDGKKVYSFIPWRTDCGSYRLYNPASGNFENGLTSSDLSRSNWCPGTTTNPVYIPLGDLKAGKHVIQVQIPQGASEGTSFSSWNVSGVILGDE